MKITIKKRTTRQVLAIERVLTPESRAALQTPAEARQSMRRAHAAKPQRSNYRRSVQLAGRRDARPYRANRVRHSQKYIPGAATTNGQTKCSVLSFWVGRELERIAALFASTSNQPTPEEIKAGINDLDFGPFGIIDWYAHRQGYQDQDDAAKVAWVRVCECMRIDNERIAF